MKDPDSKLFSDVDDGRLSFLRGFSGWLDRWKEMDFNSGKLSNQTFRSISFSCRSLADAVEYLLIVENFDFVLSATFQSDCIEGAFGIYRQSVGGSFHLTHDQALAVEKKMRVQTSIMLHGKVLQLDNTFEQEPTGGASIIYHKIDIDFEDLSVFDKNLREVCSHFGGYILRNLLRKVLCSECLSPFCSFEGPEDEDILMDISFFESMNRGRLLLPSQKLSEIVCRLVKFFETYLEKEVSRSKLGSNNLKELFHLLMMDSGDIDDLGVCSSHQDGRLKALSEACVILSKMILKNFTIAQNDSVKSSKPGMAKKNRFDTEIQFENSTDLLGKGRY